jgi:hypothetical protein
METARGAHGAANMAETVVIGGGRVGGPVHGTMDGTMRRVTRRAMHGMARAMVDRVVSRAVMGSAGSGVCVSRDMCAVASGAEEMSAAAPVPAARVTAAHMSGSGVAAASVLVICRYGRRRYQAGGREYGYE